jgi:hypothetical protein
MYLQELIFFLKDAKNIHEKVVAKGRGVVAHDLMFAPLFKCFLYFKKI